MQRPWGRNGTKGERNDWWDPKKDKWSGSRNPVHGSLLSKRGDLNSLPRGSYLGSPRRVRSWHNAYFFEITQTRWFPRQFGPVSLGLLPRVSFWTGWPDLASKGHFIQKQHESVDQIHWKASVGAKWDLLKNPGLLFVLSSWIQKEEALVTKGWHMDGFLFWLTDLDCISLVTSHTYPVTHRYS